MIKSNKTFTLIELLVVVAIIGILASMLMPSLSEARKKARIAVEVSNRKQLYAATMMYCDDNNDFYPHRGDSANWLHVMRQTSTSPNLNIILLEAYVGEGPAIREEFFFCDSTLFEYRGPNNPYYSNYTNNHTTQGSNNITLNYYVIPENSGTLSDNTFYNTSTTSYSDPENALWSCMILEKPNQYWLAHDAGQTEYGPPGASTVFVDGGAQWIRSSSFRQIFVGASGYNNFIPMR